MSLSKVNNYIEQVTGKIFKDNGFESMYLLGYANGLYQLYTYLKSTEGKVFTDKTFRDTLNDDGEMEEYFRNIIESAEQPNTKFDDFAEVINRHKEKATNRADYYKVGSKEFDRKSLDNEFYKLLLTEDIDNPNEAIHSICKNHDLYFSDSMCNQLIKNYPSSSVTLLPRYIRSLRMRQFRDKTYNDSDF